MSTLIEIEQAIEKRPSSELRQFHHWIAERDADDWDAEIARDAAAGKFDALRQRVTRDNDNGLSTQSTGQPGGRLDRE